MGRRAFAALAVLLTALPIAAAAQQPQLLYAPEGNRLRRYDIDTIGSGDPLSELVFQNAETDPENGRDINGMVCPLPGEPGLFIAAEDTGQPHPPAGWGLLTPYGAQLGKLTPTYLAGFPEPYGCAFDASGRLFTTSVGHEFFGSANGQLILWFPPFDEFPGPKGAYPDTDMASANACKIATDLGTALGLVIDDRGRVLVAEASSMEVVRFSPPFPTGPDAEGGCGEVDETGAPMAEKVQRERLLGPIWSKGLVTYSGLAFAPNGNLYVSSVATGRIAEVDPDGHFVRMILEPDRWLPPFVTGSPQGLAVDARGSLYYADLDLAFHGLSVDTGPDGKLWRIRFDDAGNPLPPEVIARGLAFPDAVSILPGDLEGAAAVGVLTPAAPTRSPPEEHRTSAVGILLITLVVAVTVGALVLAARRKRRPFEV